MDIKKHHGETSIVDSLYQCSHHFSSICFFYFLVCFDLCIYVYQQICTCSSLLICAYLIFDCYLAVVWCIPWRNCNVLVHVDAQLCLWRSPHNKQCASGLTGGMAMHCYIFFFDSMDLHNKYQIELAIEGKGGKPGIPEISYFARLSPRKHSQFHTLLG